MKQKIKKLKNEVIEKEMTALKKKKKKRKDEIENIEKEMRRLQMFCKHTKTAHYWGYETHLYQCVLCEKMSHNNFGREIPKKHQKGD